MLGQKSRPKGIDGQHRTAWASWLGQFSCPLRNMLHTFWVEGGNGRDESESGAQKDVRQQFKRAGTVTIRCIIFEASLGCR